MKTNYHVLCLLLLVAVAAGSLKEPKVPDSPVAGGKTKMILPRLFKVNQTAKPATESVSKNLVAMIQQDIAKREYHISLDQEKGVLQSPNRKQNLRAYYKPGELTIKNRIDSAGHNFKLELVNEGIYADGKKLFTPQTDAISENNENTLRIKHEGFTEEYVNNEQGVRQNFIINSAPEGTKKLEVKLTVDGLKIKNAGKNKLQLESHSGERLTYSDLKCWDASGKLLDASLAYESEKIGIKVNVEGAVFPVVVDPLLGASNSLEDADTVIFENQNDSSFGTSLSSAGDFNGDGFSDVIIGAYRYDLDYAQQGAAFLYFGSKDGIVINSAKTITYGQANDDNFGGSVSTAGDVNGDGFSDLIIGVSGLSIEHNNQGGALIVYGNSQGLVSKTKLLYAGSENAFMGNSVASAGDVNGDGYSDVIVGAQSYFSASVGAALLYYGSASGINENKLVLEDWANKHYIFGSRVAAAGDVNGDGYGDVLVGAPSEMDGKGAAYVFMGSSNGLITIPGKTYFGEDDQNSFISGENGDILGSSVASAGDVNGDGYSDIIIGSAGHIVDPNDSDSPYGAAYVYYGSANGLSDIPDASIFAQTDDGVKTNRLGYCVASAGDINGDGYSDIILGARHATLIYYGSSAGIQNFNFSAIKDNKDFLVDLIVSSAGDVNGDGISDIILSGRKTAADISDEILGIFIFHGSTSGIKSTLTASGSGLQANESLGFSLANAGDLNGDGFNDIVIGAPYHNVGGQNNGLVRVHYGSLNGINFGNFLKLETLNGALFGYSTSSAGDVNGDGYGDLIVGASNYSNGENLEGAVFVYHGSPTGIATFPSDIIEGNQANAQLGFSLSGAGDVNGDGYSDIVVSGINNKVLVYFGSATGLKTATPTALTNNGLNAILGRSVAGIGDFNGDGYDDICASSNISGPGNPAGTAFIFFGNPNGIQNTSSTFLNMNSLFCQMVASAGDVNGDGFGDVIAGTTTYSNGESNEGAAFIYHGTADKGVVNPAAHVESNQANASMGYAVSSAGDVNGDGYGDVTVSAPFYNNGEANEGIVNLYLGSPTGIVDVPQTKLEGNIVNSLMGMALSSAGDVNGDGFSEILVGLPQRDVLYANAGLVQLYAGNAGFGLRNNLRLYNSNLSQVINHDNISKTDFGLGLFAKSFLGKTKAKLVWETRKEGEAFSHNDLLSTSMDYTDKLQGQITLNLAGSELKSLPLKVGKSTRVRARVKYDPVLAITGQLYGPWRYLPGNSLSQASPLPVTLVNFTAEKSEKNVLLEWITSTEENSESFEVQRSRDAKTWKELGSVSAQQNSSQEWHYQFTDSSAAPGNNFYRLKMIDQDQTYTFSRVRSVSMGGISENMINLFPNPTVDKLSLSANGGEILEVRIINVAGSEVMRVIDPETEIDVKQLKPGVYIVVLQLADGNTVSKSIVKK